MGKKKSKASLGRSIIRDRFGGKVDRLLPQGFLRHSSDIDDGFNWARLDLKSVTEESNLNDFLATAELAGTDFTAEKLNINFVNPSTLEGLLSAEEKLKIDEAQKENQNLLSIPRRPKWDSNTTTEDLLVLERDAFLTWRKQLAELQGKDGILLTPFEKNLEVWKQLWRVLERSDIIAQIVDARNPLLFRCADLEKYVQELSDDKMNMILVNKADFLTEKQRFYWADYFKSVGLPVVFFSAVSQDRAIVEEKDEVDNDLHRPLQDADEEVDSVKEGSVAEVLKEVRCSEIPDVELFKKGKLCSRMELIEIFKRIHSKNKVLDSVTTVGLVGYPNVGKSSTINAILTEKKVSVSATPGKTKHFQTLYVDSELQLCDSPGLVMPSFISTKAEMVVNGILPIDQMKDHVGPINIVASRIPRHILSAKYSIFIPPPMEGEDEMRSPTSEELLNAYGYMRGFMTQRGLPDNARAARYILKDYVSGKLLYCHSPPNYKQEEYHQFLLTNTQVNSYQTALQKSIMKDRDQFSRDIDTSFFSSKSNVSGVHVKKTSLVQGTASAGFAQKGKSWSLASSECVSKKPWRNVNKRNKREKLRRVYAHLDA